MDQLEHKPGHHKGRLAARKDKEVAEKFSEKIFSTTDRLGKNERINAVAEVLDYRIGHEQRGKDWQGHERVFRQSTGNEKIAVDGNATSNGRTPTPPQQPIAGA